MRKTTLTVFFHTIFPSDGERFIVGAGRLFCWSGCGERNPFCRFDSPGPNGTRKTTLTVFFHTIFLHKQPAPRCGLLMKKPENAHTVQRGSLCPDRTRREDPLMVLPSHIPPLAWGQACALGPGAFFFAGAGTPFSAKILIFCCISGVISVI